MLIKKTARKVLKKIKFVFEIKKLLGYYPFNLKIYQQALTHKSVSNKHNEMLEFLGDSVLNQVVSSQLYKRFTNRPEGFLSKNRAKIVNRKTLQKIALKLGVDKLMKHTQKKHTKSVAGDAFEALIGAMYLDRGYIIVEKSIIKKTVFPLIDLETLVSNKISYKSEILELFQKQKKPARFNLKNVIGKDHDRTHFVELIVSDTVISEAQGRTIKQAQEKAAKNAYINMNNIKKRLI